MFHVTERLLLRPAWPEDADALFGGIADEGVVRNLASAPWPYLPKHADEFVMRDAHPFYPRFLITFPTPEGSEIVGCVGIDPSESGKTELGYWIARAHWGRGFASEAAQGMLEVARLLGHQSIEAGHFIDNPASGKVLRKIGFVPTGKVVPRHSRGRGAEAPCALYRLVLTGCTAVPSMAA
ncbi:GNAT family N-acetyltransferase [Qipengyuania qiaonensis]|uniref:GNAT family N-acetyltransferase n=1 Tax=Qipengyuania qiaonensis TaxID=2867240 RepID=A0ABS7J9W0_9SPHN|nr:GNAT family N-acetyltransferase [Qipengyuania qiaonensis]MBX7483061.1 GNAT family N-acetyltransferase [Qipengyuania qiaonensis]